METTRLADGRAVEYVEVGDPGGRPVVHLHGTPATAGSAVLFDDVARRCGVRLVAVSRPGYGASTTSPPGLLSVATDVGELLTGLGIDEFVAWGTSGGGPYALALGAELPSRVRQVLVAAGIGPVQEVPPAVLGPEDLRALALLAGGDVDGAVALATTGAERELGTLRALPAAEFEAAFRSLTPPTEHYFDTRAAEATRFFADVHRAVQRLEGYVRDNLSWTGPWDFDLIDVVAPVVLAYGEADVMVPPAHGAWLHDALPASTLTVHPGAGHGDVTFGLAERLLAAPGGMSKG